MQILDFARFLEQLNPVMIPDGGRPLVGYLSDHHLLPVWRCGQPAGVLACFFAVFDGMGEWISVFADWPEGIQR